MEPPMSNGSMHHREPKSEIDDTRDFLQGASCTIAAGAMRFDLSSLCPPPRFQIEGRGGGVLDVELYIGFSL
jgi:hypothetical protein